MDVGGWLRRLGLGQYEAPFRASEIDADILPYLTDVDLKELGSQWLVSAPTGRYLAITECEGLPEIVGKRVG